MINKLIDGICRGLYNEFGEEYHIYTEKIEQRFTRPCFFVEVNRSSTQLFRGNRYLMQNKVLVTFYPGCKRKRDNMAEVAQRVSQCLEFIVTDGAPLRCNACTHTFNIDELKTELGFDFFVNIVDTETAELMEEYSLKGIE